MRKVWTLLKCYPSSWFGMKLKFIPRIPLVKWWLLMTLLTGSRNWCKIYRPDNKNRAQRSRFYIYIKLSLPKVILFAILSMLITPQVYFLDWSVNYCKALHLLVCQVPDMKESWNFYQRKFLTKGDYWWSHHLGHLTYVYFIDQKINIYNVCYYGRSMYVDGSIFISNHP